MRGIQLLPHRASDLVSWRLLLALRAWARRANFVLYLSILGLAISLYYCYHGLSEQILFYRSTMDSVTPAQTWAYQLEQFHRMIVASGMALVVYAILSGVVTAMASFRHELTRKLTFAGVIPLALSAACYFALFFTMLKFGNQAYSNVVTLMPSDNIWYIFLTIGALGAAIAITFAQLRGRFPRRLSPVHLLLVHQALLLLQVYVFNTQYPIKIVGVIR